MKDEESVHLARRREAGTTAAISDRGWQEVFLPSAPQASWFFSPVMLTAPCLFRFAFSHS